MQYVGEFLKNDFPQLKKQEKKKEKWLSKQASEKVENFVKWNSLFYVERKKQIFNFEEWFPSTQKKKWKVIKQARKIVENFCEIKLPLYLRGMKKK